MKKIILLSFFLLLLHTITVTAHKKSLEIVGVTIKLGMTKENLENILLSDYTLYKLNDTGSFLITKKLWSINDQVGYGSVDFVNNLIVSITKQISNDSEKDIYEIISSFYETLNKEIVQHTPTEIVINISERNNPDGKGKHILINKDNWSVSIFADKIKNNSSVTIKESIDVD